MRLRKMTAVSEPVQFMFPPFQLVFSFKIYCVVLNSDICEFINFRQRIFKNGLI